MGLAWMFAVQAATAAPSAPAPIGFDLAKHRPARAAEAGRGCAAQSDSDIVVCGRRGGDGYRLRELDGPDAEKPLVAEVGIGGGAKGRAYVEGVELQQGLVSKRVMVGVKVGF